MDSQDKRTLRNDLKKGAILAPPGPPHDIIKSSESRARHSLTPSSLYKSFFAGTISGIFAAIMFQPLDVLKTRLQASINKGHGAVRLSSTFVNIVKNEPPTTLWNGLVPSMSRCVPGMGMYFSIIHILNTKFVQTTDSPNMMTSLCMGATARSISVAFTLPFTVVKTRFECGEFHYINMIQAFKSIHKTEGFKGLYSGLAATLLRDAPFSAFYYTFYTQFKSLVKFEMKYDTLPSHAHFMCGLCAGLLASATTQPADVIKTHIQMYPHKFTRLKHALSYILEKDGWVGFWRGLSARMIRRTLVASSAWTVYEKVMKVAGIKT